MSKEEEETLIKATEVAATNWRDAFNAKNADGCAEMYEMDAEMLARPFGSARLGRPAIKMFWKFLIDNGYGEVKYQNVICFECFFPNNDTSKFR